MENLENKTVLKLVRPPTLLFSLIPLLALTFGIWFWGNKSTRQNAKFDSGPVAENFAALDHMGQYFELYRNAPREDLKAVVLITHGLGCPVVQKNIPVIKDIVRDFSPKGIRFLFVNSQPQDTREAIFKDAQAYQIDIPILLDQSQVIARGLRLTRTCEAVVIETRKWKILYQGAIDDRLNYGFDKFEAKEKFLINALNAYLSNQEIGIRETKGIGCAITIENPPNLSFAKDIYPILQKKCLHCHQESGSPPQNLARYEDAKAWSPMIREVIRTHRMPPWEADNYYTEIANDNSLTPKEASTLVSWVESQSPRGDIQAVPKPVTKTSQKPFSADLKFGPFSSEVPAQTQRPWKYIDLGPVDRDLWIRAKKTIVNQRGLLGHISVIVMKKPMDISRNIFEPHYMFSPEDIESIIRFPTYDPNPQFFPDGTAFKIPKGSHLYLEQHFALSGKPDSLQSEVHFQLAKAPGNLKSIFYKQVGIRDISIPPNQENYILRKEITIDRPLSVMSMTLHMHMRGMAGRVSVTRKNGDKEVLFSVPRYLFKNKANYFFKKPHHLHSGDRLEVEGHFNNSPSNPYNLDWTRTIRHGADPAENEMFFLLMTGLEGTI